MQNIQKRILFTLLACSMFGATDSEINESFDSSKTLEFASTPNDKFYKLLSYRVVKLIKSFLDISTIILAEELEKLDSNKETSLGTVLEAKNEINKIRQIVAKNSKFKFYKSKDTDINEINNQLNNIYSVYLKVLHQNEVKNEVKNEAQNLLQQIFKIKNKIGSKDLNYAKKDFLLDLIDLLRCLTLFVYFSSSQEDQIDKTTKELKEDLIKIIFRRTFKTINVFMQEFTGIRA